MTPIEDNIAYHYHDTFITICTGLGTDNWATCKLSKSGAWKTLKTPAMPRTEDFCEAINNFHEWAEKKKLRRADCGCCWHGSSEGGCTQFGQLKKQGGIYIRHSACREHEKTI